MFLCWWLWTGRRSGRRSRSGWRFERPRPPSSVPWRYRAAARSGRRSAAPPSPPKSATTSSRAQCGGAEAGARCMCQAAGRPVPQRRAAGAGEGALQPPHRAGVPCVAGTAAAPARAEAPGARGQEEGSRETKIPRQKVRLHLSGEKIATRSGWLQVVVYCAIQSFEKEQTLDDLIRKTVG